MESKTVRVRIGDSDLVFETGKIAKQANGAVYASYEGSAVLATVCSGPVPNEELDYVIEGSLDIIVNGKTYRGKAGDVFYIPKNTTVTFSTPDKAKFFFVTYPANWAELSNYQK